MPAISASSFAINWHKPIKCSRLAREKKYKDAIDSLEKVAISDPEKAFACKFIIVQLQLLNGNTKGAVDILMSLGEAKYKPGVVSALVTLYLGLDNKKATSSILKEAVDWYRKSKLPSFICVEVKHRSLAEETVFQYLKKISITLDEPHHYFGSNVKKMLTDTLPKQMYLQREKQIVEGTSEETIVVSWGFRSELEFPKEAVLEEVAQLLRKPASSFVRQYDELHRDIEMEDVI